MSPTQTVLDEIVQELSNIPLLKSEQIPNIDLYMDQVTTFFEEVLSGYKRNESDKILTKTMINNYSKGKILPPSIKKKYTKRHIILLIMTYHLKSILTIPDIQALLNRLVDYDDQTIETFYRIFLTLEPDKPMDFDTAHLELENQDLELILIVLDLVMQANYRKRIVEKIIDTHFLGKK